MTDPASLVSGVAQRYASALFELALEARALDPVAADLDTLERLLSESPDFARLVRSPVFSANEQLKAIGAVLERLGIGGLTANFVRLVARNRRLFALPDMIRGYRALLARHRGETAAEVVSAAPLRPEHAEAVREALAKVAGSRDIRLTQRVDPNLIGGLVVRLGSRMIDASVRTKLNSLKLALKEAR